MSAITTRPAVRSRWQTDSWPDGGARPGPAMAVIGIATVAALVLRFYFLSRPGRLLGVGGFDDGIYFGSAVRLVHGVLPYRDFVSAQPPMIMLVMAPAALVSKLTGTAWGMAIGRILTGLASAAAVTLAGLLVRHRGLLAVTVAGTIMAVYPGSLIAAHSVMVEPWLVLFTLTGAVTLFDGDRLAASRRRLVWGGAFIGIAGATEAWAVFPFVVLLALAILAGRSSGRFRRAGLVAAGAAGGFALPVLPFAVAAPHGLYQDLITSQVIIVPAPTPMWHRLRVMSGSWHLVHLGNGAVLAVSIGIVAVVIAASVTASAISRRPPPPLEAFALAAAALVVAGFCWYPLFYPHFAAFLAPFLALSLAVPVSRLVTAARAASGRRGA
ncbi:MAG: hypothetical protein J2P32_14165, partial [Actinobacteria bacterium]|nr:hypothetical protein [Actinomycetota bacterium]